MECKKLAVCGERVARAIRKASKRREWRGGTGAFDAGLDFESIAFVHSFKSCGPKVQYMNWLTSVSG